VRGRYRFGVRRAPLLLAALVLAACGSSAAKPKVTSQPPKMSPFLGVRIPAKTAPPIALHDDRGRPVTLASLRGNYVLVTFIYTHCPDVCPLIASNLNAALRIVGAKAHHVSVIAVSVDPKGDTAAAVRAYAKRMHLVPRFHYLIGTRAQLHPVWSAYQVEAVAGKAAVVDHIAYTALVDPQGKERVVYGGQVRAADVVHDLRVLIRRSTAP
jgi:protein SCO1/2